MVLGRVKFDDEFDLNSVGCELTVGRSRGVSRRFFSSFFAGFLSFETAGSTRSVDSIFSVAARCRSVLWNEAIPRPETVSAVGTVAATAIKAGSDSTSF